MRTYKRINEDYLDGIDRSEYTDELSLNAATNVDMFLCGQTPNIDLNLIKAPIYKVQDKDALKRIIEVCIETYGTDCNLNWIDVSGITDMRGMFSHSKFNGDISKWDVSSVTDMSNMFRESEFNGDISGWDVSSVTDMAGLFADSKFNDDISGWNVSSVTTMERMFELSIFNGNIS